MRTIVQDLRFALRGWSKAPGFTIAVIATLALGIGANTAIFSVVSGELLRPLPFPDPEQLVEVSGTQLPDSRQGGFEGVVYGDLSEWRAKSHLVEKLATYTRSGRNLQGFGEAEQVSTVAAEPGLFGLLGVQALIGRTFTEGDPANVAVVSYGFWIRHFGGERSAIGRNITLDDQAFTVIGVMPEEFRFPYGRSSSALERSSASDLWFPWNAQAELRPTSRAGSVVARLQPGATLEAARQELNATPGPSQGRRIVRVQSLKEVVSGAARDSLLMLLGAVGMVLLVACVNVANLLLARTASRGREVAIRSALGASRFRLIRQFLTESLLLALCGGAAGLGIGMWGSKILIRIAAAQIPRAHEIGLDWRVFAFLLAVCMATGMGFGLAPAIAAARGGSTALKNRNVRASLRDALVVVEVALAFVLLAGAGLLMRSFLNLQHTNSGVNAENVLTMHVVVSGGPESLAIEDRISRLPGVRAAGLISLLPLQNSGWAGFFEIPGRPGLFPTELRFVTPGYFHAMGIPLRAGREFSLSDGPGSRGVILINEALARQDFPDEDPVGRTTNRGTIVGVVGDVRQETLRVPAVPEIYSMVAQNFAQMRSHGSTLVVRGTGPAEVLIGAVRAAVREVTPSQALFRPATMRQVIEESLASPRLYMWLLALFAGMATLLAIAGIYGVVAYLVALRTREFGIRMALGADTSRVLLLVMNRGALLIALGLALGIAGAAALTKVLHGMLYGIAATDPQTFAAMTALLALVAFAACLVPARRAARVDPAVALRCE